MNFTILPAGRQRAKIMLHFCTHIPEKYNIGDDLCSPAHYFDFLGHEEQHTLIIGGGAFGDMGLAQTLHIKPDIAITWAIGRSVPFNLYKYRGQGPRSILRHLRGTVSSVVRAKKIFAEASTRDTDLVGRFFRYVPCPSVFHPICDIRPGTDIGLFLNSDTLVSSSAISDIISLFEQTNDGAIAGTNSENIPDFSAKFAQCETIITNSYHIAYWSLLSGRGLKLIGYSSKFVNLLDMFGMPGKHLEPYHRGDSTGLVAAVRRCLDKSAKISLADPTFFRSMFRNYNVRYAQRLVDRGLLRSCKLK